MSAEKDEYQALREYLRLVGLCGDSGYAGSLRRAMEEELTPRQRQLVHMYYTEQLRMQDIADRLGISLSTVSRTIKRGREKLKKSLRYGGMALMNSLDA